MPSGRTRSATKSVVELVKRRASSSKRTLIPRLPSRKRSVRKNKEDDVVVGGGVRGGKRWKFLSIRKSRRRVTTKKPPARAEKAGLQRTTEEGKDVVAALSSAEGVDAPRGGRTTTTEEEEEEEFPRDDGGDDDDVVVRGGGGMNDVGSRPPPDGKTRRVRSGDWEGTLTLAASAASSPRSAARPPPELDDDFVDGTSASSSARDASPGRPVLPPVPPSDPVLHFFDAAQSLDGEGGGDDDEAEERGGVGRSSLGGDESDCRGAMEGGDDGGFGDRDPSTTHGKQEGKDGESDENDVASFRSFVEKASPTEEASDRDDDDDDDASFRSCVAGPPIRAILPPALSDSYGVVPSAVSSVSSSWDEGSFASAFESFDERSVVDLPPPPSPSSSPPSASAPTTATAMAEHDDDSYATALSRVSSSTDRIFVYMPRRLIRKGLTSEALAVLRDDRYVLGRIMKLGVICAAELTDSDCRALRRTVATMGGGRSSSNWVDVTERSSNVDFGAATMVSEGIAMLLDAFRRQVVAACRARVSSIVAGDVTGNSFKLGVDESFNDRVASNFVVPAAEGGRALYVLATSLDAGGLLDQAVRCYRHALGLFLARRSPAAATSSPPPKLLEDAGASPPLPPTTTTTPDDDIVVAPRYDVVGDAANCRVDGINARDLDHLSVAQTLAGLGDAHFEKGELDDALRAYDAALLHFDRAANFRDGDDDDGTDVAGGGESTTTTTTHEGESDPQCGESPRRRDGKMTIDDDDAPPNDDVRTARSGYLATLLRVGQIHSERDDVGASIEAHRRALLLRSTLDGHDSLGVADVHCALGALHGGRAIGSDLDDALRHYDDALRIRRTRLGRDHVDVARTLYRIGGARRRRGEHTAAAACFREIASTHGDVLGTDHPLVKLARISLDATMRKSSGRESGSRTEAHR